MQEKNKHLAKQKPASPTFETQDDADMLWPSFDGKEKTWRKIKEYAVLWNIRRCKGIIKIILNDDVDYKIVVGSAPELDAVANIFRQEKVVYYNIVSGSIASAWKSTGRKRANVRPPIDTSEPRLEA